MARKVTLGVFADEDGILAATARAHADGHAIYDTYTPYPVHGLDEAMGLRPTRLGIVCFALGLGGLLSALGFQLWSMGWDWPMIIGGKSYTAFPALIPVTFEFTVLCACVGTFLVFLWRAKLWPGKQAAVLDPGASDDRFVLALEAVENETTMATEFLNREGAFEIRDVEVGP